MNKGRPEVPQEQIEAWLSGKVPRHLRRLGKIIRKSVFHDDLKPLRKFLARHSVDVPQEKLEEFRDVLIIQRSDLKDLEPAARARLRAKTLLSEDPRCMTSDYRERMETGSVPLCRECRYFVEAPNDGSTNGDKPCVSFGTKGADQACFGFVSKTPHRFS